MTRKARRLRETAETQIEVTVDLDAVEDGRITTTIPFFDHMLSLMAKHGLFSLEIAGKGDTEVDLHHTVEDTGLTFGDALREALGDRSGIRRYGEATVPMDEALASVTIDLCTRPYLVFNVQAPPGAQGEFDIDLAEQFFRALVTSMPATVHLNLHYGSNQHHILEALFKAFGRALAAAALPDSRLSGPLSTKGSL